MANTLRLGLELEMHGIKLTFRNRATGTFWVPAGAGVKPETTMIALETILEPQDVGNGFIRPDGSINWESNWGFRGVGDAHGQTGITLAQGGPQLQAGQCIIELATAANVVNDYPYWIASRKCAKVFADTLDYFTPGLIQDAHALQDPVDQTTWYPLQTFLTEYNNRIQNLAAVAGTAGLPAGIVANRFKLIKSQAILAFENGAHLNFIGQNWDAYVKCRAVPLERDRWCDVQVNYQMSLRKLYEDLDNWVQTWNSIWATKVGAAQLDPAVGDTRSVAVADLYRIQTYAAMWRAAKNRVEANIIPIPSNVGTDTVLVKALMTYVLAAGSITNDFAGDGSTSKNRYPQLCKTSPASIRREINAISANASVACNTLANNAFQAGQLSNFLRVKQNLQLNGGLSNQSPVANEQTYGAYLDNIISIPNPPFQNIWVGSFSNPAVALSPADKYGFTTNAPFYCLWAHDVNFSFPAVAYNVNDIKILLESRYGRCKLNIGFNPYIDGFLFNRSYRSLVTLLDNIIPAGGPLDFAINQHFPDNHQVNQNFTSGPH